MVRKLAVGSVGVVGLAVLAGCTGGSDAGAVNSSSTTALPSPSASIDQGNPVTVTVVNDSGKTVTVGPKFGDQLQPTFPLAVGESREMTSHSPAGFGAMVVNLNGCGGVVNGKSTPGWIAFQKAWTATPPDVTTSFGEGTPVTHEFTVFDSKYLVAVQESDRRIFTLKLQVCVG